MKLNGIYTALITPFNDDYSINEKAYAEVINKIIEEGVHGIVVAGNALSGPLASAAGALQGITNPAAFVENLGFVGPETLAAGNTPATADQRTGQGTAEEEIVVDTYAGESNAANPSALRTEIID